MTKRLGTAEREVGALAEKVQALRSDLVAFLPDAVDLAYVKIAKAEIADLRTLVTQHIEADHRQRQGVAREGTTRREKYLLAIAAASLLVAFAALLGGR